MFDRLGLSARLCALSALTALLAVGFTLFKLDQFESTTTFTTEILQPQMARMTIELPLTRISLPGRHAILWRNPAERESTLAEIERNAAADGAGDRRPRPPGLGHPQRHLHQEQA